jgi:hypothetical protein
MPRWARAFPVKDNSAYPASPPPRRAALAMPPSDAYHIAMASPSSNRLIPFLAVLLALATAQTAEARTKKHRVPRATPPAVPLTLEHGTPIIMQGLAWPQSPARSEGEPQRRVERPHAVTRGSSGYVAPAPLPAPRLSQSPVIAPYQPPPVNNPSERIMQLNQSFPFNAGLGNNPTDRDAYIRYNLNR